MRVVMLLRNPYTHDTRVEKEARTLRDSGFDVVVVAHAAEGLPVSEARDGIEIRRIARPARRIPLVRFVLYARALRRAVEGERPAIVHSHDSDALGPAAATARRLNVPLIHDAHELWLGRPPRGRGWLYRLAYRLWYERVERRDLPAAAAVVTVSPPIVAYLERAYGLRGVALVPNYPELGSAAEARDLRSVPGGEQIPAGAPIVLHIGGYQPDRGLEQLTTAIAALPAPHLALLGIPARSSPLDGLTAQLGVADRVHFLAPVPSDRVIALAASATLGVVPILPTTPNNAASMPNKLFQYMAAGLPVVASDLPQLREIVVGSGAGRCVDSADPRALAAAIRSLIDDPEESARMGAAARRAIEDRYNWAVAARTLGDVYARVSERATVQSRR